MRGVDPCQPLARAFVVLEAEAKIADRQWPTIPERVNPRHITSALGGLWSAEALESTVERTRGGREIKVYPRPFAEAYPQDR
jgi:hypothetical protein